MTFGVKVRQGKAMPDRRKFMQGAIVGAVGSTLGSSALAAAIGSTAPASIQATRLAEDLVMYAGAGGNVITLGKGTDGLLMVDSGAAEHTDALLRAVEAETGTRRITTAFNTHWHWDHTGGNEVLTKSGTSIMAQAFTRQWLMTSIFVPWQDRLYARRPAAAVPKVGFYGDGKLQHAGQEVAYGHLWQAHTDGDIYLHFPKQNVLVVGDLLAVGRYPILDYTTGGWIGGMADANRKLLTLCNDQTRIVPGTGPVQTRADLQAHSDMLAALRPILVKGIKSGMNGDDMIQQKLTKDFDAKWGKPELFLQNAYLGLWAHARELGGIV
jgi:glyoxylase-like metal-dependent hydrolase (beta-lactamase superfamily II)